MAISQNKFRETGYFQYEPPEEYRRTYFVDELNKISRTFQILFTEFFPTKNARAITSDETLTILDDVVLVTGTTTITLYDAAGVTDNQGIEANAGSRVTIKNIGTGSVTIDGSGTQTIDGTLTKIITEQYVALELFSDGSNWYII